MDGWGKPKPSNGQYPTPPTETSHPVTAQRLPSRHQKQSETQPRHTIPPPASLPNTPAPWQLGRHSQYLTGTAHDQQSPNSSVQPIDGSPEGDAGGNWGTIRVQRQVNEFEEGRVVDVEEELHRRLKARQVRLLSFLSGGHLTPLIDFNDCIRRHDRYRFSHRHRDGSEAR